MNLHKELESQGSCLVLTRNLGLSQRIFYFAQHSNAAIKDKLSQKADKKPY